MSYAIFRSESINTIKDLGQIGAHNKRDKKAYQSDKTVREIISDRKLYKEPVL